MEVLTKKEMLEIKNPVTEMKKAFHEIMSRLDIAEGRIWGYLNINLQNWKAKRTETKKKKKNTE